MKTFIITAALSVLSLGNIAGAQDGKSIRTHSQIVEEMLASLPTYDTYTPSTPVFSLSEQRLLSLLPTIDVNVETPGVVVDQTSVAQKPSDTVSAPKTEVKAEIRRTADK
ncbi:hypothetical protein [Runella slithyformis]|uniref:Uncharacterized protein n=1 Tax=Runella slithyformis (strain ATCC 29530 / DSM 19594 / LMG 11500 / NCIMB 11436 / LSU 4) TaxID=761193 RepID=A0A7U3ZQW2_RUNSL|nr:hypothetical protein [Runella slithyformis]AEI51702.1 hypothetical protein Runsl_5411 [Runella slithyformis DSM 19594]